jgi:asparagine synthase (glutamine-hydrolysing)
VVLLDGQGGDETLLGYDRYYAPYFLALWRQNGVRGMLKGMRASVQNNQNLAVWRLAAYVVFGLVPAARHSYYRWRNRYLSTAIALPEWIRCVAAASWDVRDLQVLEVQKTGLPPLLRYEDKNSMAYAIETRLPFLDYRLVEKTIALAPDLKIRNGWTKYVLRKAMGDVLPSDIAWRRNKIGFEAPTEIWLTRHLDKMTREVCGSPFLRRICDEKRLQAEFPSLDRNTQWRLYSLGLWEQAFGVTV